MMASKPSTVTQSLLARGHSPDSAARLFADKIQHRTLHLHPSSPTPNGRDERRRARVKQEKSRKKALKPRPLSARQRKKLALYDVPKKGQKYCIFEPLHQLWLGYVREILGNEIYTGGQGAAAKLSSADFHGAHVEVVRSRCVSRVGVKGIVIKDTRFVLEVITRENQTKTLPKEGTVFRIKIPALANKLDTPRLGGDLHEGIQTRDVNLDLVVEVHGDQFMYRAADRANKKFKAHFLKNL
jgi:ribonuclease P protein subunit POP4